MSVGMFYSGMRLVISIDLSETTKKSVLDIRDNVRDKIQSETKFRMQSFNYLFCRLLLLPYNESLC